MAEAHRDEIAKLEALYAANPGGRVFAHLAEAYRKAGELERAREILEQGLARHPDFASAYVVLARVQHDRRDDEGARRAFQEVLRHDAGNLIALRFLADDALGRGERAEALDHYRELLNRDLSDGALRERVEQLGRELGSAPWGQPRPERAWEPAAPEEWPARQPAEPLEPVDLEHLSLELPPATPLGANSLAAEELFHAGTGDQLDAAPLPQPDAEPQRDADVPEALADFPEWHATPEPGPEPVADSWAGEQWSEAAGPEPTAEPPAAAAESEPWRELDREPGTADVEPEAVPEVPAAESPVFEVQAEFEAPAEAVDSLPELTSIGDFEGVVEVAAPVAGEPEEPRAAPEPEPAYAAEAAADGEADLLTETMADLYRGQGFADRAAEVYRALLARDPANARLRALLAEVEAEQAVAVVGAAEAAARGSRQWLDDVQGVESAFVGGEGAAAGADTPYAWDAADEPGAGGIRISEYFRSLLSWRPAAEPADEPELLLVEAVAAEEPGPIADEPVVTAAAASATLSDVESEERTFTGWTPDDLEASPVPPAAPVSESDLMPWEFAEPAALAEPGSTPADSPFRAQPEAEPGPAGGELEAEDEDLEIFRSWLQSLKK